MCYPSFTVLAAILGACAVLPTALALPQVEPRADAGFKGGYYDDPKCTSKGYFLPKAEPYGIYGHAECHADGGDAWKITNTWLDLNKCLVNIDGQLKWLPNGGAFGSCHSCESVRFHTSLLNCMCRDNNGSDKKTTINLNEGISRDGNSLRCYDYVGGFKEF